MKKNFVAMLFMVALMVCLSGCGQQDNGSPGEPAQPATGEPTTTVTSQQREDFYDLARTYAWQMLPEFDRDTQPTWNYILMYAFALNGYTDTLEAEFVDEVAGSYFGILNEDHSPTGEWTYANGVYTATGWEYPPAPYMELLAYEENTIDGQTQIVAVGQEYSFAAAEQFEGESLDDYALNVSSAPEDQAVASKMREAGVSYQQAIRQMIVDGDTAQFVPRRITTVIFVPNEENEPQLYLKVLRES